MQKPEISGFFTFGILNLLAENKNIRQQKKTHTIGMRKHSNNNNICAFTISYFSNIIFLLP